MDFSELSGVGKGPNILLLDQIRGIPRIKSRFPKIGLREGENVFLKNHGLWILKNHAKFTRIGIKNK